MERKKVQTNKKKNKVDEIIAKFYIRFFIYAIIVDEFMVNT